MTTPGKPKKGDAVRVNDRFEINDPGFAKRLWEETGLKELVCEGAGLRDDGVALSVADQKELWSVPMSLNAGPPAEWVR